MTRNTRQRRRVRIACAAVRKFLPRSCRPPFKGGFISNRRYLGRIINFVSFPAARHASEQPRCVSRAIGAVSSISSMRRTEGLRFQCSRMSSHLIERHEARPVRGGWMRESGKKMRLIRFGAGWSTTTNLEPSNALVIPRGRFDYSDIR